jgi:hypothetical protein
MNIFQTLQGTFTQAGMAAENAGALLLIVALLLAIAMLWYPYMKATEWFLRRQRRKEEDVRTYVQEEIRPKKDAARAQLMRQALEDQERIERARAESLAAQAIFEAEQRRLAAESERADEDLQQIKKHLEDTRPEFERAMQMGHEVLAIRARDATIRKSGGEPPLFRATQVMRAVNQQLYDHQVTGRPITQPAFMEYEHHPCMR